MTEFTLGPGSILSYKRLSYTPWHALAEFVDNSTQSYFDNQEALDAAYLAEDTKLRVTINYDNSARQIVIEDNSFGMESSVLKRAMTVGQPPPSPTGRSRYGMGLKTAACWLGDHWTVQTSQMGSPTEYTVVVDVEAVASGRMELPTFEKVVDKKSHYTIITISDLNVGFRGRRIGKTKDYLASMYRNDLRARRFDLIWQGDVLQWQEAGQQFLKDGSGRPYRRTLELVVDGRRVAGWVGILAKGGRSQAGFSIFHSGRMIRGFPESWRPQEVFGQEEGSNNLINQRIVGEFDLDDFPATHTKDDLVWSDDEEAAVERAIRSAIDDYLLIADRTRVRHKEGPQPGSVKKARQSITGDAQRVSHAGSTAPSQDVVVQRRGEVETTTSRYASTQPDVEATLLGRRLRAYFTDEESGEALFAAVSHDPGAGIIAVANLRHPFLHDVVSAETLDLYLRLVMIDAATATELVESADLSQWIVLRDSLMRRLARSSSGGA